MNLQSNSKSIVILHQYFSAPYGKWSQRFYEIGKELVAKGYNVTVITSVFDRSGIKSEKFITRKNIDGIAVIMIGVQSSNKHKFYGRVKSYALYSLLSTYYSLTLKYDLLIASSGPITVAVPSILTKILRNKKIIFEVRDLWPDNAIEFKWIKNKVIIKFLKKLEILAYNYSDGIVALSIDMQNRINLKSIKATKTALITNGVNIHRKFKPKTQNPVIANLCQLNKKIILYAGTIGYTNNIYEIIDVANHLKSMKYEDAVFVIAGSGAEEKQVKKYSADLKLSNVLFVGDLSKCDLDQWMKAAAIIYICFNNLPILQTNSPNKLFEGFGYGKPILNRLQGRENDIAILPSGKKSPGLTFYYVSRSLLESSGNLKEFIIRQTKLDEFVFDVVSERPLTERDRTLLQSKLDLYLEPGLKLIINSVPNILRHSSGKIKHFYSEVS